MLPGLNKRKGVLPVTRLDAKPFEKAELTKETPSNSTTSGTIELEAWIMSGLVLSVVQLIVGVNLQQKLGAKPETNMENDTIKDNDNGS